MRIAVGLAMAVFGFWCLYMAATGSNDANEFWRAKACPGYPWLDTSNGC